MVRGKFHLLLWVLLFGAPAFASEGYVAFDLGAYGSNLNERFSASEAVHPEISRVTGFFRVRPGISLGGRWFFEPSAGIALPWRSSADGSTKTFTSLFDAAVSVPVVSWLNVRVGPGVQWYLTFGTGDGVELNNGTSVATFYSPSRYSNVVLLTAFAGLQFRLSRLIEMSVDAYSSDFFSGKNRRWHGVVALGVLL